mgnify:CR=1 FL=1
MMGLMDKVIIRNSGYICINDFLCHIADTQGETVGTVATWLYAEGFEKHITSYSIQNYKITKERGRTDSLDALTMKLFDRILDVAFNIINYGRFKNDENADPSDNEFFYEIKELEKLTYINDLNLDFNKAKDFSYTIFIDDYVLSKKKESENDKAFSHMHSSGKSELSKEKDRLNDIRNQDPIFQNIQKILEWSMEEVPERSDALDEQVNDNTKYSYLITIGVLLELMQTPKWGLNNDKPLFQSQSAIIGEILESGIKGQGKTTLENRFRDANIAINDAKKKSDNLLHL